MGRHRHPEEEVERAYFRPPPPPPVVRSGSTRVATTELPLLAAEPEPGPEYVWVWPGVPDTVEAIGQAAFYLSVGFFGGLGVIYVFQYVL